MTFASYVLDFISNYGYLAVFVGSIFDGESVVFLAGFFAHEGRLFLPLVIFYAWLGATLNDYFWFFLGRYRGQQIIQKWAWTKKLGDKSVGMLNKSPALASFFVRFMYGLRTIIPFGLGMSGISARTFLIFNSLGAFVWVFSLSLLGYVLSDTLESFLGKLKHFEIVLIVIVIFVFACIHFMFKWIQLFIKKVTK